MAFAIDNKRIGFALLATAATALLVWFGTGLHPVWPLMWFAPLPVLLFASRSPWWAAALVAFIAWAAGFLNQAVYFGVIQLPLAIRLEADLAPAVVFAIAVLLYRFLLRRGAPWSALLALPASWVSFEYLLNLTYPHGTAMSLSYSQLNFLPVLQLASITGPWGISFLLLTFSSGIAIGIYLRAAAPKQAVRVVSVTCGTLAAVLVFGALRLSSPPPPGQEVRVGLAASDIQGNNGVAAPGADADRILHEYAAQAEVLAARGAQAIVLPEVLARVPDAQTAGVDAIFQPLADKTGATIVVGVENMSPQARYNQARVYAPRAAEVSYNKHHLLPPAESKRTPGTSLTLLPESKGMWGIEICKDMDFTQLSRQYGNLGAGLMLTPGWDFRLDWIEHGHMAIMRGVESGFGVARAGRGGSMLVTDNRGRILGETMSNSAPFATLLVDVPAVHDHTLFLLLGDWFAWVAIATLAFVLLRLTLLPRP